MYDNSPLVRKHGTLAAGFAVVVGVRRVEPNGCPMRTERLVARAWPLPLAWLVLQLLLLGLA